VIAKCNMTTDFRRFNTSYAFGDASSMIPNFFLSMYKDVGNSALNSAASAFWDIKIDKKISQKFYKVLKSRCRNGIK